MQKITELNLPFVAVDTPEFAADPVSHFREAKRHHPWLTASDMGYWVHDYRAIRDLLGHDDNLRPAYDGIVDMLGAALSGQCGTRRIALIASAHEPQIQGQAA